MLKKFPKEVFTNCVQRAQATNVSIRLSTDGHLVSLVIADDGAGFDFENQSTPGLRLLTLRERAEFAGGSFNLENKPGQGTRIQVLV